MADKDYFENVRKKLKAIEKESDELQNLVTKNLNQKLTNVIRGTISNLRKSSMRPCTCRRTISERIPKNSNSAPINCAKPVTLSRWFFYRKRTSMHVLISWERQTCWPRTLYFSELWRLTTLHVSIKPSGSSGSRYTTWTRLWKLKTSRITSKTLQTFIRTSAQSYHSRTSTKTPKSTRWIL